MPKLRIEVLVPRAEAHAVFELIATAARTGKMGDGKMGDGKVWVVELDRLMRIRTGELGDDAV